jgi:hypothetical protein
MITITRRRLVSAPRDSIQAYLSDLKSLATYDPKIGSVQVTEAADGLWVEATGRFMGLPWSGTLRFQLTKDGGYRGVLVQGPMKKAECWVSVRPVVGGTVVECGETYELPLILRPLSPLVRMWAKESMETRLDLVKEGAEALNRRLQLERLDA